MDKGKYIALFLDAPLQSWGYASKFNRRTTYNAPTRSGLVGMISATMGIGRDDSVSLLKFDALYITVYALQCGPRIVDFHTVGGGWKGIDDRFAVQSAEGGVRGGGTIITKREYLQDTRFGVVLSGPASLLDEIETAMKNPCWGIWFGRKNCIPASPVFQGRFPTEPTAFENLLSLVPKPENPIPVWRDAVGQEAAEDILMDIPVDFRKRTFRPRRVRFNFQSLTPGDSSE